MRGLYDDLPDRSHRRAIYRRCSRCISYLTIELEGIRRVATVNGKPYFTVAMTASLSARGIAIRNSLQKTISARVSRTRTGTH